MWKLHSAADAVWGPSLAGLAAMFFFWVLFLADLPISLVWLFGTSFVSEEHEIDVAILWGVLGTVFWYLIGWMIDSYRHKRANPL